MIKQISNPKLTNPVFIAAWPGMGEVAYRTAIFLREVMGFKVFAKLEASAFFKPAAVSVDKGVISMPELPAGFFYYCKGKKFPDMILFLGEAQPPLEYAEKLSADIVDFVKKYKAKAIFTFAAKPESIDHKDNPSTWIAATHKEVLLDLSKFKMKTLKEGQISGLNGVILGVSKKKGLRGACLLGEVPFYTVQIENPKATINILKILNKHLTLNLNLEPLIERAKFVEGEIDKLINYLKGDQPAGQQPTGPTPLSEEDIEKIKKDLATYTKLPQSAREAIETLFITAQTDIAQASILKEELDRWNVYKEYEDRFLDLFRTKDTQSDIQ